MFREYSEIGIFRTYLGNTVKIFREYLEIGILRTYLGNTLKIFREYLEIIRNFSRNIQKIILKYL